MTEGLIDSGFMALVLCIGLVLWCLMVPVPPKAEPGDRQGPTHDTTKTRRLK